MNVLKHPTAVSVRSVSLECRTDGIVRRNLEEAPVKESHMADLQFRNQLLDLALEGFNTIGTKNSLPICVDQSLPLGGIKRWGKDLLGYNFFHVPQHFRALFQGDWNHNQKLTGDEPSPTRTNGAQYIGATFPFIFRKSSFAWRRADASSSFSARCV